MEEMLVQGADVIQWKGMGQGDDQTSTLIYYEFREIHTLLVNNLT